MTTIGAWLASVEDLPRLDRELLLGHVLSLSRAQIIAFPETRLPAEKLPTLQRGATALRDGSPLAYLLGEWEFWGLPLNVSPSVLIPRPETELLVELVMEHCKPGQRVLELGTGSGAIAVALAKERPDLEITAVDISPSALAVAAANAERHDARISWRESDWFTELPTTEKWNLIVSNPPYIAAGDPHLPNLSEEPQNALVSGADGLRDLRHICATAPVHLEPGGYLIVEHGYDQAARVRACLMAAGFKAFASRTDLAGIERATYGRL